jgi:uncharacterized protein (TIGR03435 family)
MKLASILLCSLTAALAAGPRFEVASVRPCRAGASTRRGDAKSGSRQSSPDRVHLNCKTAMSLIQWAYVDFASDRFDPLASIPITGGPAWINSNLFEINAKADGPRSWGTLNGSMLRALLEDRFGLQIHRQIRESPVYVLTVAKGGPTLQPSKPGSCIVPDTGNPPPPIEPGRPFPRLCGMARLTNNGWDAPGVTMESLSRLLSDNLDRTAVDKTGLVGGGSGAFLARRSAAGGW